MDALLIGTGGAHGWPEPGCRCASCLRATAAGRTRSPSQVLVDAALSITPGLPPATAGTRSSGHVVAAVPGGWDITSPAGDRLLAAGGPGLAPEPPEGTRPFDVALLDLLAGPAQLGWLRARGLVHDQTTVAAIYADHRVSSEQELTRRCALWGAAACQDGALVSGPPGPGPALPVRPHRTLILGGARSGKSREAELRLSGEPAVTYLAAGPWAAARAGEAALDAEWVGRVTAHRAARPAWWRTEESLDLAGALRRETGALLIDGIGTWLAAIMDEAGAWADPPAADGADFLAARIDDLIAAWRQTSALVAAVTDQVGEGLVPPYLAGRMFRDQLGWLNQRIAAESDLVLQVVAGRVLTLPA